MRNQGDSDQVWHQQQPADADTVDAGSAGEAATTHHMVKELRGISRARSLRLQPEHYCCDRRLPFHRDIETFLILCFDPENGLLPSGGGVLFNVIARGPLGCVLEHAKPDVSEKATEDFKKHTVDP